MKKELKVILPLIVLALSGCSFSNASSSEKTAFSSSEDSALSSLKNSYGSFSIVVGAGGSEPSYDSERKIYTLTASSEKSFYYLSGYLEGAIVIKNSANYASPKGVRIVLNNCYLSNPIGSAIAYEVNDSYLDVYGEMGSVNYLVASASAIVSEHNLRLGSLGKTTIVSSCEHGAKADKISVYGSGELAIEAYADCLHGEEMATNNNATGAEEVPLTGTLKMNSKTEQALDFAYGSGTAADPYLGKVDIGAGATLLVEGALNVARINYSLSIEGTLTATGITSSALITKNSGNLIVTIAEGASFSVNGTALNSGTF